MKRIISFALALALAAAMLPCASAEEQITVTDTDIISHDIPNDGKIIAALYGDDALTGVRVYNGNETAAYAEDMAEEMDISDTLKVFAWILDKVFPIGRAYCYKLDELKKEKEDDSYMVITVNGKEFRVDLEDNETAAAFKSRLPISLDMSELNGNEKYCYLDTSLPTDSSSPGTIHEGDIMLFGSNCIVIFYKTFNTSYSYTKIGHISDTAGLAVALGKDGAEVRFE